MIACRELSEAFGSQLLDSYESDLSFLFRFGQICIDSIVRNSNLVLSCVMIAAVYFGILGLLIPVLIGGA